MIHRLIAVSIRHRAFVIVAAVALAVLGVRAIYQTPIDAIPDLSEHQVLVFAAWPGHSPQELEDQVTYPIAIQLQGVDGVRVVRSSSDVDYSLIHVIFEDSVSMPDARDRVHERLAGIELPRGVVPALGPDAAATGQIFWYTVEGTGQDPGRLRAIQDWYIRPQLAGVSGVAEVASVGGFAIEYQIEPDPLKLQARGVTLAMVMDAVAQSNAAAGADVIHKGNAEFVVRSVGWLGAGPENMTPEERNRRVVADLERVIIPRTGGSPVLLREVANVSIGARPRRGSFEKDGNEVCGGVVMMRHGENPLEVTRRLRAKILELRPGLPEGVRIVPCYDRTPLIEGAVATVTDTLWEAMLIATLCVLLVLRHLRASLVITLTLPLVVLSAFVLLDGLRQLGVTDAQTNIMSLAGLTISIGVLVDSSVVMTENVMHHLHRRFGDEKARGDLRSVVLPACQMVGRPMFFAIAIMLLSFLPVFALGGIEGRMFRPLVYTKTFALLSVAFLSITLVPALCTVFVRGRIRSEEASPLVRGVIRVYRPVLSWLLDRPGGILWIVAATFVAGSATIGIRWILLAALAIGILIGLLFVRQWGNRLAYALGLILAGLIAEQNITPPGREFMTPLDEGMSMDMPITVPRASITQATDDMKARNMILCRFPEVDMVVGKAGRAETPADPAPLDMIETMVNFRPRARWPKRKLKTADAERHTAAVLDALLRRGLIREPTDRAGVQHEITANALARFDVHMREVAYQSNRAFERQLGLQLTRFTIDRLTADRRDLALNPDDLAVLQVHAGHLAMNPTVEDVTAVADDAARLLVRRGAIRSADELLPRRSWLDHGAGAVREVAGGTAASPFDGLLLEVQAEHERLWRLHLEKLNGELHARAAPLFTRLAIEETVARCPLTDPDVATRWHAIQQFRDNPPTPTRSAGHHHREPVSLPDLDPVPELDAVQDELGRAFATQLLLWQKDRADLVGFGGELDRSMQMPGWTNVWTMPIQNRVDMLATGINTDVGVRVLGRQLDDVVAASNEIAAVLKNVRGAADVVADPIRGKGYLEVRPDRDRAAEFGISVGSINEVVETALGGRVLTTTVEGRERHPVRLRFPRDWRIDEESTKQLPIPRTDGRAPIPLHAVADVRIVEGPASIKGENGLLRNYVRLNVRGRDSADFVEEARRAVAANVQLPPGVHVEWTGRFEHESRAHRTLLFVVPAVIGLIGILLYFTFHDAADAALIMLAVPGALAGGLIAQGVIGLVAPGFVSAKFSVTVGVGYIACFGMATATGVIMLVYLRDSVARAGGLERLTPETLRQAVLDGAAHRLRPKLLTEATTILGLAPLLWATGPGSEVLRPMVLPVLGGLLVADEVIDLFLPVLFYRVRLRRLLTLRRTTGTVVPT
jgi:Cu(I)/Ag(I) efflux system membrane protein CusA/SilA